MNKTFTFKANLVPTVGILIKQDDVGIVQITSAGSGRKLIVADHGGNESLGIANNQRLREVIIDGAEVTDIDVGVFTKKITTAGACGVNFGQTVDSGADSELKFIADNDMR